MAVSETTYELPANAGDESVRALKGGGGDPNGTVTRQVITPSDREGYAPGQAEYVGPMRGATVVVGTEFTRPADTTAYAANDAVSNSTSSPAAITLNSAGRHNNGSGYITGVKLTHSVDTVVARFRVWFYQAAPTPINDNAAFSTTYAEKEERIGYVDLPAMADVGNCAEAQNFDIRLPFQITGGGDDVYALLQVIDGFTPGNAATFYLQVAIEQN